MASYIETTAVALRKGDTTANLNFTGVLGELVADLGYEEAGTLGIDGNVTLRLHNGVTMGGIPMCRADMRNITTKVLAENRNTIDDKNLAYADLSNIEETDDAEARSDIVNTLSAYGMVNIDLLEEEVSKLALADMSNVLTSTLATGRGRGDNGNLAYADTSNMNTADLVDPKLHYGKEEGDWPLAYASLDNIDTSNLVALPEDRPETVTGPVLAARDFSNITAEIWQQSLFDTGNQLFLEQTTNKDFIIDQDRDKIEPDHYPTTGAVSDYVRTEIDERGFLLNDFTNADTWYPLYSNGENRYRYRAPKDDTNGVVKSGRGFALNKTYWTGLTTSGLSRLSVNILAVDTLGYVSDVTFEPAYGVEDLSAYPEVTIEIQESTDAGVSDDRLVKIGIESIYHEDEGLFYYYPTTIDSQAKAEIGQNYRVLENINLSNLLSIRVLNVVDNAPSVIAELDEESGESGEVIPETGIAEYEFVPEYGDVFYDDTVIVLKTKHPSGENAEIRLTTKLALPGIGGAGLLKSDLTNLLGMTEEDKLQAENFPWRIRHGEPIPSVALNSIPDSEFYNLTTAGCVWYAIKDTKDNILQEGGIPSWKANTEYVITPERSKVLYNNSLYECIKAHKSGNTFDATNWKMIGIDTYEVLANKNTNISLNPSTNTLYPTNNAVVKYVKEQIDAVHIPGHYQGQVNIFVPNENALPGNTGSAEYTIIPTEGLTAVVENYNGTNKPKKALYTNNAWTYEDLVLQNGVYLYVLNLGATYYDGPGNITWNTDTNKFDVAPDKFQVPDGTSLDLNASTGAIQIVPYLQTQLSYLDVSSSLQNTIDQIDEHLNLLDRQLAAMIIPAPQFFTGNGMAGQQLILTDDVAFDLYVNGVFQYPNSYVYDSATKTITLNWAVEDTKENGICVVYRGFRTL